MKRWRSEAGVSGSTHFETHISYAVGRHSQQNELFLSIREKLPHPFRAVRRCVLFADK
jgi:hypothetical protein